MEESLEFRSFLSMQDFPSKLTKLYLSITRMKRGSVDITPPKDNDSGIRTFLINKKATVTSLLRSRSKQNSTREKVLEASEEEEALRCLDAIIESESQDGDFTKKESHHPVIRPLHSPSPFDAHNSNCVRNSRNAVQIKYDTIKGFDTFMLY